MTLITCRLTAQRSAPDSYAQSRVYGSNFYCKQPKPSWPLTRRARVQPKPSFTLPKRHVWQSRSRIKVVVEQQSCSGQVIVVSHHAVMCSCDCVFAAGREIECCHFIISLPHDISPAVWLGPDDWQFTADAAYYIRCCIEWQIVDEY